MNYPICLFPNTFYTMAGLLTYSDLWLPSPPPIVTKAVIPVESGVEFSKILIRTPTPDPVLMNKEPVWQIGTYSSGYCSGFSPDSLFNWNPERSSCYHCLNKYTLFGWLNSIFSTFIFRFPLENCLTFPYFVTCRTILFFNHPIGHG